MSYSLQRHEIVYNKSSINVCAIWDRVHTHVNGLLADIN